MVFQSPDTRATFRHDGKLIDRRQRIAGVGALAWHAHRRPYAAVVLAGSYIEAGDGGRRRVSAGDVIIHTPFCAHGDRFDGTACEIVNLDLSTTQALRLNSCRTPDPEALLRDLDADPSALDRLLDPANGPPALETDLPDRLAAELDTAGEINLADWADRHATAPRTLRRQFGQVYGITPAHYRARARARLAWRRVVEARDPLAAVALDTGFADQAHMTRAITALTGASPRFWRRGLAV